MFKSVPVVLLTILGLACAQNTQLKIGEPVSHFMHTPNWNDRDATVVEYYQFTIEERVKGLDVVIIAKGLSPNSDPDIYISKTNPKPTILNSDYICNASGLDVCVVPFQDIPEDKPSPTFYVAVECVNHCRYQVSVSYDLESKIGINDFQRIKFSRDDVAILKLVVPSLNSSIYSLEITASVINIFDLEEPFRLYLNRGSNVPSSSKFDMVGMDAFTGDKVLVLETDSPTNTQLKEGLYTILLEGTRGCEVEVTTRTFGRIRDIHLFERVEDTVLLESAKYYRINLAESPEFLNLYKTSNLIFQLVPYSGYPDIYVNPAKQPTLLNAYKWNNLKGRREAIIVTQLEQSSSQLYYIAIYGESITSSYMFNVLAESTTNTRLVLNEPYKGLVEPGQVLNYRFVVYGKNKQDISVKLKNLSGASALALKYCGVERNSPKCQFTAADIESLTPSMIPNKLTLSSTTPGDKSLTFEFQPELCSKDANNQIRYQCVYAVGIFPQKNPQDGTIEQENEFQIKVKSHEDVTVLRENESEKELIAEGRYHYYQFTLFSQEPIRRLHFQITPIQGDVQLFASRQELFPDVDHYEKKSEGNVIRYSGWNNEALNGTYYISVYGYTSGLYMITPLVVRDWGDMRNSGAFSWQYAQLTEGDQQEAQLDFGKALFKVDLSSIFISHHTRQNISVQIDPLQGSYQIYGSSTPERDMRANSIWRPNVTNYLEISAKDPQYPKILYLHIYSTQAELQQQQFRIVYYLEQTIHYVYPGQQFKNFVNPGDKTSIKVSVTKDQTIYITKLVQSLFPTDVEIYYSLDEKNSYPTPLNHDGQIFQDQATTIKGTDVMQCQVDHWTFCYIYIQAFGRASTFFTLLVNKEGQVYQLQDGAALKVPLRSQDATHLYYNIPQSCEAITVLVSSNNMNPQLFASILKTPIQSAEYPSSARFEFTADTQFQTASLNIGRKYLQVSSCESLNCTLLISVLPQDMKIPLGDDLSFTIVVSSQAIQLTPATVYTGQLKANEIQYFSFTIYQPEESIVLSVTSISDTLPALYVSYGATARPTPTWFDWTNSYNSTSVLISAASDSRLNQSTIGTYIVGVVCQKDCIYSLSYSTGSFQLVKINKGFPYSTIVKAGSIFYFDYYNYQKNDLKFMISIDYGKASAYGTAYIEEKDLKEKIFEPLSSYPFSKRLEAATEKAIIRADDKEKYCTECHYLIAIAALTDTSFSIVVTDQYTAVVLQSNLILRDHTEKGESNLYHYYGSGEFSLYVSLFAGDITIYSQPNIVVDKRDAIKYDLNIKDGKQFLVQSLAFPPDDQQKSYLTSGVYSFDVVGNANSNYSIQCTPNSESHKLKLDQPHKLVLHYAEKNKEYHFKIKDKYDAKLLTISITMVPPNFKNQYPEIKLDKKIENQTGNKSEYQTISNTPSRELKSAYQLVQRYEISPGHFLLYLSNIYVQELNMIVTLSVGDTSVLVQNQQQLNVQDVGTLNTWQIFASQPSKLLVNVVSCRGTVNLYTGEDLNSLSNGHYLQEFKHNHERQIQGVITVDEAKEIFLATKAISGQKYKHNLEAVYKINYEELPAGATVPFDWFEPEYEGVLDWEFKLEENTLRINYPKLICKNDCASTDFTDVSYTYTLFLTGTDLDYQSFDLCTVSEYDPSTNYQLVTDKVWDSTEHRTLSDLRYNVYLNNIPRHIYIHFNVMASVTIKEKDQEYKLHYYYIPNKISENMWLAYGQGDSGFPSFLVFTLFALVILAFIGIMILYRRNKMLKSVLKYELSDVRNVARLPSPSDGELEMKHTSFMDDQKV